MRNRKKNSFMKVFLPKESMKRKLFQTVTDATDDSTEHITEAKRSKPSMIKLSGQAKTTSNGIADVLLADDLLNSQVSMCFDDLTSSSQPLTQSQPSPSPPAFSSPQPVTQSQPSPSPPSPSPLAFSSPQPPTQSQPLPSPPAFASPQPSSRVSNVCMHASCMQPHSHTPSHTHMYVCIRSKHRPPSTTPSRIVALTSTLCLHSCNMRQMKRIGMLHNSSCRPNRRDTELRG